MQYYRPWKLTREQEDIIQDQIADAKEAVERDGEAFRIRERKHREQYRRLTPPPKSDVAEGSSDVKGSDENTTVKVADAGRPSTKVEKDHDDSNEVIVMDEDTVIY